MALVECARDRKEVKHRDVLREISATDVIETPLVFKYAETSQGHNRLCQVTTTTDTRNLKHERWQQQQQQQHQHAHGHGHTGVTAVKTTPSRVVVTSRCKGLAGRRGDSSSRVKVIDNQVELRNILSSPGVLIYIEAMQDRCMLGEASLLPTGP